MEIFCANRALFLSTTLIASCVQSYHWIRNALETLPLACYRVVECAERIFTALRALMGLCCTAPFALLGRGIQHICYGKITRTVSLTGNVLLNTQEQFDTFFQLHRGSLIHIKGTLVIAPAVSRIELPPNLHVEGDLYLTDCTGLMALPPDLQVDEALHLKYCTGLKVLPDDLQVGGSLYLSHCTGLTVLPNALQHIRGSLDLTNCIALRVLPPDLQVDGMLDLTNCIVLKVLPNGLRVKWALYLNNCIGLAVLPNDLHIGGSLDLTNCTGLTVTPHDLHVGGSLYLTDCIALRVLSNGLHVEGSLYLNNCIGLMVLPTDLHVGGSLYFNNCTGLTVLPNWITALGPCRDRSIREVHLINTGLSEAIIERLRATPTPGMLFFFSQQAARLKRIFPDISTALDHFRELAGEATTIPPPTLPRLSDDATSAVLTFLNRMTATADYKNKTSRPILAHRLLAIFCCMATDAGLCAEAMRTITDGLSSCDDRTISSIDTLELMVHVHRAKQPGVTATELRQLAQGLHRLEKVDRAAAEHLQTLTWVDAIEVYLAFRIGLRERLRLPLLTQNTIFRRCAQVTDVRLQEVGDTILREESEGDLEAYLNSWDPWRIFQRRHKVMPYSALPQQEIAMPNGGYVCSITKEETSQPVFYGGQVYDYNSWVKWFIEDGRDPLTREPLDWVQLKKIASKSVAQ